MQREVIKWLQSLDLSNAVQNPKRDLATGHAVAEIVSRYSGTKYIDLQRLPSGASAATKRDVWLQVYAALQKLNCQSVTPQLVDAVLRREPNAALTVLECLYEHFTGHTLQMRGLDAVGTIHNAYVQPANAASTAKLLAVASGSPSTLQDPLQRGDTASATAAGAAVEQNTAVTADRGGESPHTQGGDCGGGTVPSEGQLTSPDHAARMLQQRLALIDNDELAGGANALGAYPRYARPTASTLVHAASGTRKDVVLDRPKYTADEARQRAHNTRITQQHDVVRRLQEAEEERKAAANNAAPQTLSSSWPALKDATDKRKLGGVGDDASLTTVYRGRFYREPAAGSKKAGGAQSASEDANNGSGSKKRSNRKQKKKAATEGEPALTDMEVTDELDGGGESSGINHAAEDVTRSSSQEKTSRVGSASNSRAVPKLRVKVHSTALKTALALRSGSGQLRERAAALSRELFAKHQFMLRPAISEVLADVLSAHKQLEHLLDCSTEDGSGEVLDNVLGHLLAHRQAFPLSCLKACWETLSQHVDGIVAALQQTPDEYSYLLECLAFLFTREAATVPVLLQLPSGTGAGAVVIDGYGDGAVNRSNGPESGASVEGNAMRDQNGIDSVASPCLSSLRGGSVDKAATPSTRQASEGVDPDSAGEEKEEEEREDDTPRRSSATRQLRNHNQQRQQQQQQPLLLSVNARQQLDYTSAFHLLFSIARQLDVTTAGYLLKRYVLRAAKPFLLRHGTAAVREAVARVVSASFAFAGLAHEDSNNGSMVAGAAAGEADLVAFLTSDLAMCLQVSPLHPPQTARIPSLPTADGASDGSGGQGRQVHLGSAATHVVSSSVQRQRAYWHAFLHIATTYGAAEVNDESLPLSVPPSPPPTSAVLPAVDGPLARCVHAAAVRCLDSVDADVRAVGVRLAAECCARWWAYTTPRTATAEDLEKDDVASEGRCNAAGGLTREALRKLVFRALDVRGEEGEIEGVSVRSCAETSAAWWNTFAPETWELRLAVLRLCTTLLLSGDSHSSGDVCGVADVVAAACLSTFAAATATPETANTPARWQLQSALAVTGRAVDSTRAPLLTAAWTRLLCTRPSSLPVSVNGGSGASSWVIPSEGLAVQLLLAPLLSFGSTKLFPPRRPSIWSPLSGAAGAAALQRAESLLSANRSPKSRADSRATTAAAAAAAAVSDGRSSVQNSRTQRTAAPTVLNDTTGSLNFVPEHNAAPQVVCARVQSAYPLLPLYQTWNTRGVLDAVLSASFSVTSATAASADGGVDASAISLSAASCVQLQVVLAALAAAALDAEVDDDELWRSVLHRLWPLLQPRRPSREVLEALGAHPPAVIQLHQLEDSPAEVMAVMVVALFLRCADKTSIATAVATAADDWRALCDAALQWTEVAVGQTNDEI